MDRPGRITLLLLLGILWSSAHQPAIAAATQDGAGILGTGQDPGDLTVGGTPPAGQQDQSPEGMTSISIPDLTEENARRLVDGIRPGLSAFFIRSSKRVMRRVEPELIHINLSLDFATISTAMDPNRREAWQQLLDMSSIADPDDERVNLLKGRALQELSRIDPADEVIRLRRLLWIVEQQPTVEGRLRVFEKLLEPDSIKKIGDRTASRLALDMAQLMYRSGDIEGYATRLAEAVDLDPASPRATATAAGYFGSYDDPITKVELLIAALIADPVVVGFATEIGSIALANGAYDGAARMLDLARMSARSSNIDSNDLAAKQALALWGQRKNTEAIEVIDARLSVLDQIVRDMANDQRTSPDPVEVARMRAPIPPSLAILKAAILSQSVDRKEYRDFVAQALSEFQAYAETELASEDIPEEAVFELLFQAAVFAAWQGEDAVALDMLLEAASDQVALSESMQQRFKAWKQIALGNNQVAIEILDALPDLDPLSRLAKSIALKRVGDVKAAATIWLDLARTRGGSNIGLWCRGELEKTLSTQLPTSQLARDINQLIGEIPVTIDRLLLGRDQAYSFRLQPVDVQVEPFEPILYRIDITNMSGLPLSISSEGPLRPTVALAASITRSNQFGTNTFPWIIFPIDRLLAIDPRESLEIVLDVYAFPVGEAAFSMPDSGLTLGMRGVTNFDSIGRAIIPGRLGEKAGARLLRVDGVTADAQWRRDAINSVARLDGVQSIYDLQLMLHTATLIGEQATGARAGYRDLVIELYTSIYPVLPSAVRAWLLASSPEDEGGVPGMDKVYAMFDADRDALVMRAMLARLTWDVGTAGSIHPYFELAMGSEDPLIVDLGTRLKRLWEIAEEDQAAADAVGR